MTLRPAHALHTHTTHGPDARVDRDPTLLPTSSHPSVSRSPDPSHCPNIIVSSFLASPCSPSPRLVLPPQILASLFFCHVQFTRAPGWPVLSPHVLSPFPLAPPRPISVTSLPSQPQLTRPQGCPVPSPMFLFHVTPRCSLSVTSLSVPPSYSLQRDGRNAVPCCSVLPFSRTKHEQQ